MGTGPTFQSVFSGSDAEMMLCCEHCMSICINVPVTFELYGQFR